ncbi:Zinc finger NF-X1-type [Trinorchestia longiramus]|nr:Zinc finger NF-X1-type [Trinorchestia longiramus]
MEPPPGNPKLDAMSHLSGAYGQFSKHHFSSPDGNTSYQPPVPGGVQSSNNFAHNNYMYAQNPYEGLPGNYPTFLNSPIVYNSEDSSALSYSNQSMPYGFVGGASSYGMASSDYYGYGGHSYGNRTSHSSHTDERGGAVQGVVEQVSNGTTFYVSAPPLTAEQHESSSSAQASAQNRITEHGNEGASNSTNSSSSNKGNEVSGSHKNSKEFPSVNQNVGVEVFNDAADGVAKLDISNSHVRRGRQTWQNRGAHANNDNSTSDSRNYSYYNSNHRRGRRGNSYANSDQRDGYDSSRGRRNGARGIRVGYGGQDAARGWFQENRSHEEVEEEKLRGCNAALAQVTAFMGQQQSSVNCAVGASGYHDSRGRNGREGRQQGSQRWNTDSRRETSHGSYDKVDRTNPRGRGRGRRRGKQNEYSEQERRYGYGREINAYQEHERNGNDSKSYPSYHRSSSRQSPVDGGKQGFNEAPLQLMNLHDSRSRALLGKPCITAGRGATEEDVRNQREQLIEMMRKGSYECVVCCDRVRPQQAIWSCSTCFNCFHLGCIKKWANSSLQEGGWRCPTCNDQNSSRPNAYKCFCGKVREPEYNHTDIPHSCGELCGHSKDAWCVHKCNELCHPGPCPPCMAFIKKTCGCGAVTKDVRCSSGSEPLLCGGPCGKKLSCTAHTCSLPCHVGACEDCTATVEQNCYCTKNSRSVKCDSQSQDVIAFECGQKCGKSLDCGHHKCERQCHEGDCDACQFTLEKVTTCPCGKKSLKQLYDEAQSKEKSNNSSIPSEGKASKSDLDPEGDNSSSKRLIAERQTCSDPIPTCGSQCGKRLLCGKPGSFHTCQAECHEGPCPVCPLSTPVRCRCGNMDKNMPCERLTTKADEVTCLKQCKKIRFCGRHKCGIKCCIDVDHVCHLKCGKWLSCGKHKCSQECHRGMCQRCPEVSWDDLCCHCGSSSIPAPVPCGTKAPLCGNPCQRRRSCPHPASHECHPEQTCPPCTTLVEKPCFGKHKTMRSTPCYLSALSCGELCDKPLRCGHHKCDRVCHDGPCIPGSESQPCPQKCTKERPGCGHPCNNPCHSGQCPGNNCRETVTVSCKCGTRTSVISCSENEREYRAMASVKLAQMQHSNSGGTVDLSSILGSSKDRFKRLECQDACHAKDRITRLALALQIENPESRNSLGTSASTLAFSDFLKNMANKDPQFASMVHQALSDLVIKARESKQRTRSHSFAPMPSQKRQFIHEYSKFFGCTSMAYDEEPKKNVVVTAQRGMCLLPVNSVVSVVQRENGHKRVPGPVWGPRRADSVASASNTSDGGRGNSSGAGGLRKLERRGSGDKESEIAATPPVSKPVIDYFDFEN